MYMHNDNGKSQQLGNGSQETQTVKRFDAKGGWYSGASANPSFQRGMLKGFVRTIKAENSDSSVVCKVSICREQKEEL